MRILLGVLLAVLVLPVAAQERGNDFARSVREFVAASNRHDVDAMVAATAEDFRWIQVVGDRAAVEVVGHGDLRSWLDAYFASTPTARSEVGPVQVNGLFASAVEIARWNGNDGTPRAQASTSVYEFAPDGRIRHVWYFNAQPVDAATPLDDPE
jgi:ketosteroid isomerase-like protein